MCPDDPHQFIIDKLRDLQENGLDGLEWYIITIVFVLNITLEKYFDENYHFNENISTLG